MKVLWTHNFPPDNDHSGVFMKNMYNNLHNENLEIDTLYLGNLRSLIQIIRSIRNIYERSKEYDLVHAQFGSMVGFVSIFSRAKTIVTLRGSDWHKYSGPNFLTRIHNLLARFLTNVSLFFHKDVIVMSNRMKNELLKLKRGFNKIEVITDPIDLEMFIQHDKEETLFKKSKKVLFTSIIDSNPVKRAFLVKESIRLAKIADPNIELKIASVFHLTKCHLWFQNAI